MKKLKYPFLQCLVFGAAFLMYSCDADHEATVEPVKAEKISGADSRIPGPVFSFPISLNRVDLFTVSSAAVSGTVTVEIRNADGSAILGTTTVSGSSLVKGNNKKNTFWFSPALTLSSGQKYRIYLTRSNSHNHVNDNLYWRTCSGGVDGYPKGIMNYSPGWLLDYSFVTYSDGYVDQQQTSMNYGFAVSNTSYMWQEFVPSKIWVIGTATSK